MENLTYTTAALETFFNGFTRGDSLVSVQHSVENGDLLEVNGNQRCQVALGEDTEIVSFYGPHWSEPFASKVRVRTLRAVFWADHPSEALTDEDEDLNPEEAWAEGESMINQYVEETVREELGLEAEVISTESTLFSPYGGYYVELQLKHPVSVAFSKEGPVARSIQLRK